jgi:hypothetical protein
MKKERVCPREIISMYTYWGTQKSQCDAEDSKPGREHHVAYSEEDERARCSYRLMIGNSGDMPVFSSSLLGLTSAHEACSKGSVVTCVLAYQSCFLNADSMGVDMSCII